MLFKRSAECCKSNSPPTPKLREFRHVNPRGHRRQAVRTLYTLLQPFLNSRAITCAAEIKTSGINHVFTSITRPRANNTVTHNFAVDGHSDLDPRWHVWKAQAFRSSCVLIRHILLAISEQVAMASRSVARHVSYQLGSAAPHHSANNHVSVRWASISTNLGPIENSTKRSFSHLCFGRCRFKVIKVKVLRIICM